VEGDRRREPGRKGGQEVLGRQKKTGWEVGEMGGEICTTLCIIFQFKKCKDQNREPTKMVWEPGLKGTGR